MGCLLNEAGHRNLEGRFRVPNLQDNLTGGWICQQGLVRNGQLVKTVLVPKTMTVRSVKRWAVPRVFWQIWIEEI